MESDKKADYKFIENLKYYGFTEFSVKPSLLKDYVTLFILLFFTFTSHPYRYRD